MALTLSASSSSSSSRPFLNRLSFSNSLKTLIPISVSIPIRTAKQQSSSAKKRGKKRGPVKRVDVGVEEEEGAAQFRGVSPLPKPPAGFVVDSMGRVLMASSKRLVTIVDSLNNLPLECVIRRIFASSNGDECMLLCPVDMPVQILKSTNNEGWSAVDDDEVEPLLPAASYALAKIHMHLVVSGFCYTARGGFCYSEEDIFEFGTVSMVYMTKNMELSKLMPSSCVAVCKLAKHYLVPDWNGEWGLEDCFCGLHECSLGPINLLFKDLMPKTLALNDGQDVDGLPTEGVEITCFNQALFRMDPSFLLDVGDGTHYMIYTPSDPLLFVAVKDENGHLQIADDDLLNDPAVVEAIDEETEFNALVEEETALLESLLGKR
ncbi:hypothetical protein Sjap_021622 [Stephania japonica]|uniref:Uncharacterized protein n=1 Tax=Stephania japonica TaxID=461633 RepID=A0AAP0EPX5_9MAGN